MDDADAALAASREVRNPFPTPPPYWSRYTQENLRLLALLKTQLGKRDATPDALEKEDVDQEAVLSDEIVLPTFPLLSLKPPRLDWILEAGEYSTFGEPHSVSFVFTSLWSLSDANGRPPINRLSFHPMSRSLKSFPRALVSLSNFLVIILTDATLEAQIIGRCCATTSSRCFTHTTNYSEISWNQYLLGITEIQSLRH